VLEELATGYRSHALQTLTGVTVVNEWEAKKDEGIQPMKVSLLA